jgi:hypothetical protein
VVHGRKLGRHLGASGDSAGDGFRTLNLRFAHWKPAASGIFAVLVHGLSEHPLPGVANLGIRPSLDPNDVNGGRVLLETHCLEWPAAPGRRGAYGKIIRVELLHKLHDELVRQPRCPHPRHREGLRRRARLVRRPRRNAPPDHARPNLTRWHRPPPFDRLWQAHRQHPAPLAGPHLAQAQSLSSPETPSAMSDANTPDYRSTLNLPDTPFPMRGDLPKREPAG